ncbi:transcription termination/antitermination protein NusG [Anaerotignum sp. MB30-C6]|uniref:transcription termination/antitermination protein NusG n=1 Tax=Anaerotignum sp. MB30-C6 TaxID=3070814 RepID=UPI0027DD79FF|nr:transcription termination/antitermination protein NusG [Anaerotignum sp. MB30-C6]WMI80690.1 transcription termination/antitermination protein NusG [Anaerotignum sp. MB30-C6]
MSEEINKPEEIKTSTESRWYVVHTYSGYENKVKANIEKTVENRGMQDLIHEISVPLQDVVEIKDGQKKTVQRKVFPGYVLIKMIMNDETWYVVRNTRGVTSFVGPGSKPVPLTDMEVRAMGIGGEVENLDVALGDSVRVISGPFADSVGQIKEINTNKKIVVVSLSIFGRETPVELDFAQIDKI